MDVVASLSQGRTAAAQCGLFTHKSVPAVFEPPCNKVILEFTAGIIVMEVKWIFGFTCRSQNRILGNNQLDALFHVFFYFMFLCK